MECEPIFNENIENLNHIVASDLLGGQQEQQATNMEEHYHHLNKSYAEINELCGALNQLNIQARQRQQQITNDLQYASEHHASPLISLGQDVLSQVMTFMDEDGLSQCQQASHTLKEKVITQDHWQYLADLAEQQHCLFPISDQDPVLRRQQECMHQWLLLSRQNHDS